MSWLFRQLDSEKFKIPVVLAGKMSIDSKDVVLVASPLRSIMKDQIEEMNHMGISAVGLTMDAAMFESVYRFQFHKQHKLNPISHKTSANLCLVTPFTDTLHK